MFHEEKAVELFLSGCNCSQSVFCAFTDKTGLEESFARRMVSPFGGGMGRLREVCGAVTGMLMVLGILYGYDDVEDKALKKELYERVQDITKQFETENGSIICRELLGLQEKHSSPTPQDRTPEYYKTRPCAAKVQSAARILEKYLQELEQESDITGEESSSSN